MRTRAQSATRPTVELIRVVKGLGFRDLGFGVRVEGLGLRV